MEQSHSKRGELRGQLELQFAQDGVKRAGLENNGGAVSAASNVIELKFSVAQRLMNSMPGIQSVLKRAERLDW